MPAFPSSLIAVSIVSHGQADLLRPLLEQLADIGNEIPLQVLITENLGVKRLRRHDDLPLAIEYLVNESPKGFGENHNAAFSRAIGQYFCVMNPDIRLKGNSLSALIAQLQCAKGVAGPRVVNPFGALEDSARRVPTIQRLLARHVSGVRVADYPVGRTQSVDWMAGMCLMFDAEVYRGLGGFDDRYHLYCEDVDICLRAHLSGWSVSWTIDAIVEHDARRDSRHRPKYLWWHIRSMARLLMSSSYREFRSKNSSVPKSVG